MASDSNSFKRNRGSSPTNDAPSKALKSDPSSGKSSRPSSTPPPRARIVESITPEKSGKDPNEYRVLKFSTGLNVALISRKNPPFSVDTPASSYRCLHEPKPPAAAAKFYQWPSLYHSAEPACHFIEPIPNPWHQDPVYQFISTPTLADIGCKSDGDPIDDEASTILNRLCTNVANTTSVALVVNAGGLDDPLKCQGLHHFTEHMVHYGSTRFPEEDAVNSVVANFGTYNATTRPDTTNYYNEVPDVILERNLERFSDMIAQPIFNMEVVRREVYAVDNEFYLRLPVWRRYLLLNHIAIKNPSHSLARFICGSLETLGGGTDAGNKMVQNVMKENHEHRYVASAMTLTINSTKSIDELQELAIRHFSHLRQGEDGKLLLKTLEDMESPTEKVLQQSKHVFLQGLSNEADLTLVWHLPASLWIDNKDEQVLPIIIHMLSDSGPVGLNNYLQNRELIFDMYAYPHCNKYATILEISFLMTENGRQNPKAIEDAAFEYIHFLADRLFEEMKLMNLRQFHFGSQMTSLDTTQDLAMRLQYVEANKLLVSESWRDSRFNFDSVQKTLLNLISYKHLMVIETVPRRIPFGDIGVNAKVQTAPYSHAKFVEVSRTNQPRPKMSSSMFSFVAQNNFLKPDFNSMQMGNGDRKSFVLKCPNNCGDIKPQQLNWQSKHDLHDSAIPKISGWHRGHSSDDLDCYRAQINIVFGSPSVIQPSSRTNAIFHLWANVIKQKISSYISELKTAGFKVSIVPGHGAMTLRVTGFPEGIESVVEIVVKAMLDEDQKDDPKIVSTEKVFTLAKHRLQAHSERYLSGNDVIAMLLVECYTHQEAEMSLDFLGILEKITLQDVQCFMNSFKHSAFSMVELRGNLPIKTFSNVANLLERMPFAPIWDNNRALYSTNFLPLNPELYTPGETCIRVKNLGSEAFTTTVLNCYVLGTYGGDQREADLFGASLHFMNTQAFMDLRTKQQLGYSVYVRKQNQNKVRNPVMMFFVAITATASKHTSCELDQKIDAFLEDYKTYLENIPDDLFQTKLKLTCTPRTITKDDVATWFHEKFPVHFGRRDIKWKCLKAGIKKQSIQVLSGNAEANVKKCSCDICASIKDWQPGSNGSQLRFARGEGISERYFISSPKRL